MNSQCGLYEIVNTNDGKRYVGSSLGFRARRNHHFAALNSGKHHSKYLQRAYDKHGAGAFVFRPIIICAEKDLLMFEQRAIDILKPEYNVCVDAVAPMRGRTHSVETRRLMSGKKIGVKKSDETRRRMSIAMAGNTRGLGKIRTQEQKDHLSRINKGKKIPFSARQKMSAAKIGKTPRLGTTHSAQSREKMSLSQRARWRKPQ